MSDNTTITPRDDRETAVVGAGRRIATAIGILITAATTLLAAFGDMQWITDNLPMLGVGLGSLVSGGIASYIAVRRMRVDRAAKTSAVLLAAIGALTLCGCVAIRATSDAEKAGVLAFGTGADSAAALANVAVNGAPTEGGDSAGVSFDSGNTQQQTQQAIQSLITLGAVLAPLLPNGSSVANALSLDAGIACAPSAAPAPANTTGFNGAPGENGEGVYGNPACSRCRAYRAAHPEVEIINVSVASNAAAMWNALRERGYTGATVALPVEITADGYTTNAK
ncbi:MAG TPA: hypothetical protein PKZ08_05585 [Vicinamibacterales bacterium]|nr:hypothetical protein [Vicinamibacterales bacterium]